MKPSKAKDSYHILFVLRSYWWFDSLRSFFQALQARGCRITVLFDQSASEKQSLRDMRFLSSDIPGITMEWARRSKKVKRIVFHARELLSFRRYLLTPSQDSFYRERWRRYVHQWARSVLKYRWGEAALKWRLSGVLLRLPEKLFQPYAELVSHLRELSPDAVVATPMNMRFSTADLEYIKAAKSINIPTVLPVASWDNLTNKGLVHVIPDLVLIWNNTQREEAIRNHQIPAERMRIVGSMYFDRWFIQLKPSTSREEFCSKFGMNPGVPFFLYLGSSSAAADDESWLIEEIRARMNKSENLDIRMAGIVIRPHPSHFEIYRRLEGRPGIFIVPGLQNIKSVSRDIALYFDTVEHSAAVIEGGNTSAMIEVLIMDKPGIVVLTEGHRQEHVLHFQQFIRENVLEVTKLDKVCGGLEQIIRGVDTHRDERHSFVKNYIRPRGIKIPAAEHAADELESLLASRRPIPVSAN